MGCGGALVLCMALWLAECLPQPEVPGRCHNLLLVLQLLRRHYLPRCTNSTPGRPSPGLLPAAAEDNPALAPCLPLNNSASGLAVIDPPPNALPALTLGGMPRWSCACPAGLPCAAAARAPCVLPWQCQN